MGLGRIDKLQLLTRTYTKTNTRWLVHSWNTFSARTSHQQFRFTRLMTTWTWGKPPPSPLQYTLCLSTKPTSKWHFVSGLPNGSPKIAKIRTFATLEARNFACKPRIEMRSIAKLQPLLIAFQWYVARHLHARKSGRFPIFSGRESNCQFDSQPFFWP